jgi:hypothetical protein
MLVDRLAASFTSAKPYATIAALLDRGADASLAVPGLVRPALVSAIFAQAPRPILVALAGEENAERFWRQTAALLGRERVLRYPDRADLPWTDSAPDLRQLGERAKALHALDKNLPVIVVCRLSMDRMRQHKRFPATAVKLVYKAYSPFGTRISDGRVGVNDHQYLFHIDYCSLLSSGLYGKIFMNSFIRKKNIISTTNTPSIPPSVTQSPFCKFSSISLTS